MCVRALIVTVLLAAALPALAQETAKEPNTNWPGYPQDSPHISNRSKYVCEERLLVQHLRETLHQRAQPLFAHGWD